MYYAQFFIPPSITEKELKSSTIPMDFSISSFSSISFCFRYSESLLFAALVLRLLFFLVTRSLHHYGMPHFIFGNISCSNVFSLFEANRASPAFFCLEFAWYVFSHPFTFMYIFLFKVDFV